MCSTLSPSFCVSSTANLPVVVSIVPGVADLSALLGVEAGLVEQQFGRFAGLEFARRADMIVPTKPTILARAVSPLYLSESSVGGSSPCTAETMMPLAALAGLARETPPSVVRNQACRS